MLTFETIAALKAASAPASLESAFALGYYAANDGGGGEFYYDTTSTATDDGGTVIQPAGVSGSGRWIAVFEDGVINFKRLGAKGDGISDNHAILQDFLDAQPGGAGFSMSFPNGAYYFSDTIEFVDKNAHFYGDARTFFQFPAGKTGLRITRVAHIAQSIFERLNIQATGKDPLDTAYNFRGCEVFTTSTFRDCRISGFSGHGMAIYGSIGDKSSSPAGLDVSLSRFERITLASNSGHGVWVVGSDANQCHFTQIDARDNGQFGVYDQSFLGNMWYTCHCNNNGAGPYWCQLPTTQSTFENCYSEMYNPNYNVDGSYAKPSRFDGSPSIIIGGLHGAGTVGGTVLSSGSLTPIRFGDGLAVGDGEIHFYLPGDDYNIHWRLGKATQSYYGPQVSNAITLRPSLFEGDTMNFLRPDSIYYNRLSSQHIVALKKVLIGNRLQMPVNSLTDLASVSAAKFQVLAGDRFMSNAYNGRTPEGWVCTRPGVYAPALSNVTGTANGPTIVFSDISNLLAGDTVVCNGVRFHLDAKDGSTMGFYVSPYPTFDGTLPVSFVTPVFKAFGQATGTTAQRPTALTSDDQGWQYYDTDENKLLTWNGAGFVDSATTLVSLKTITASQTLNLTDAGHEIEVAGTSAVSITIPVSTAVSFPLGTEIRLFSTGATATVVPDTGVTLLSANSYAALVQYGTARLVKIGADSWKLDGDLT